jgi:hypothetical protein
LQIRSSRMSGAAGCPLLENADLMGDPDVVLVYLLIIPLIVHFCTYCCVEDG